MKSSFLTRRWTPIVVIMAVLIVVGGPMFNSVMKATGGRYIPEPFTALSVNDPITNFTGFAGGDRPKLTIYNGTYKSRTYHWRAVLKGKVRQTGSVTVPKGQSREFRVSLANTNRKDQVRVELVGMPQFVVLQVWPHPPVSYIRIVPTTTSSTDLTNITGDKLKDKFKKLSGNGGKP